MNLFERLRAAGISASEATDIVQEHADVATGDIDVDRLTKAMEGVASSFGEAAPPSAVDAAVQEASDIVDAVTKGADALLVEQRSQYEALAKGMLALADEVRDLRSTMRSGTAELQKSLTAVADEPVARRSISAGYIPAPGEMDTTDDGLGYNELLNKAINELKSTENRDRAVELRKAVAMLESGFSVTHVSAQFGIN
jgi:hypothetical protein